MQKQKAVRPSRMVGNCVCHPLPLCRLGHADFDSKGDIGNRRGRCFTVFQKLPWPCDSMITKQHFHVLPVDFIW